MTDTQLPSWNSFQRIERWVAGVQVAVATLLLGPALAHPGSALPGQSGMADLPGTVNFHWLVQTQTLQELRESSMVMYPSKMDRLLLDGMPFDALASLPFTAALGWPAGFTVFVWLSFVALGLTSAWFARGWWGHAGAAAIAGVVAQTQPYLIRELMNGRPTQVFGTIFLPLCLGYTIRALTHHKRRDAVLAGVSWGLGTLAYWYYGAFFGVCIVALLLVAHFQQKLTKELVFEISAGLMAVILIPLAYVLNSTAKIPGQGSDWSTPITHGNHLMLLEEIIDHRDLGSSILHEQVMALQIVVAILTLLAIKSYHRRMWTLPAIWLGAGVIFAMGPNLGNFDIPGPFALFELTELTARMWWPDRALVMAVPAFALLAAGGAKYVLDRWAPDSRARWAHLIAVALLIEAFVVIPGLPLPVTWGAASPQSEVLARGEGPVLILPVLTGGEQPDARMLIDQMNHGRPLINGPMPYTSTTAPESYQERMKSIGLAPLLNCESSPKAKRRIQTPKIIQSLRAFDLTEVYLDENLSKRFMKDVDAYRMCIAETLQVKGVRTGPFTIFKLWQ